MIPVFLLPWWGWLIAGLLTVATVWVMFKDKGDDHYNDLGDGGQ